MHSYQDTKQKVLIHICILVTRTDVPKVTYTWMKFFRIVDLSNYIASRIQYFHIDKATYNAITVSINVVLQWTLFIDKEISAGDLCHDISLQYIPSTT